MSNKWFAFYAAIQKPLEPERIAASIHSTVTVWELPTLQNSYQITRTTLSQAGN